jgi:predicted transport protein
MGDIKLFRIDPKQIRATKANSVELERSLQTLIENNLETALGVSFLATEFLTGRNQAGRIDTLGIDENNCPVIIEYKRAINENVINQGLFYLDWLFDHKADFKLLVQEKLSREKANEIDWNGTRLICIAGDFTRYDEHAVKQINRNIELIRYRKFDDDLLLLEQINIISTQVFTKAVSTKTNSFSKSVLDFLPSSPSLLKDRYEALRSFLTALGDDVQVIPTKHYVAFKKLHNFACVTFDTRKKKLFAYVKVDPSSIKLRDGFTRDMRNIGHVGTGDLEITIASDADFDEAKPLLVKSYEAS